MADEPNKRMDEMLKAYADRRRQEPGASVELHPATRQMLQAEVARTYKQVPRVSWLQKLVTLWPRVAFAGACLIITLTLVLIALPRKTVTQMAQRKLAEEALVARDSRLSDKEKADSFANGFADAPAPTVSTAPVTPPLASVDRLAKQNEADEMKAKSEALAERGKDLATLMLRREESAGKEVFRQSYANTDAARARYLQVPKPETQLGAKLQTVQPIILKNFELEQVGDQVRVFDEDGSVYAGNVVSNDDVKKRSFALDKNAPSPPGRAPALAGAAGPAQASAPAEQPLNLYFRAIGTNLSLKQQVAIEANIYQMQTNVIGGLAPASDAKQNERRSGGRQQVIRGNARVGTNQPVFIEINAVPAQP